VQMYELKVTLNHVKPPIWRAFQVPREITLARLHKILQIAMGWEDYHLYEFRLGSNVSGFQPLMEVGPGVRMFRIIE